jgi:hypothetical protein
MDMMRIALPITQLLSLVRKVYSHIKFAISSYERSKPKSAVMIPLFFVRGAQTAPKLLVAPDFSRICC